MSTKNRVKQALYAVLLMAMSVPVFPAFSQEARKPISRPAPPYPDVARRLQLSGTVKVQVVIAADGQIKETKIIGGHPLFVNTVEETLKKWRYAPSNSDTTVQLEFDFHP
jgi:protein TonB